MRVLALAPAYADSPIDGLHVAVKRRWPDDVVLMGSGRVAPPGGVAAATLASYDLVLMADPCRRGSEFWPVKGVNAQVKAVVLHDSCWGVTKQLTWAAEVGVNLILMRVKSDVSMVIEQTRGWDCPPSVQWQPFGFDPAVFSPSGDEERPVDVIITGHLGHVYPMREQATRALRAAAAAGEFVLDDLTLHGCAHPTVTGAAFAARLARAKIAVVTSSKFHYVLMKYYEAPACGCAMVCQRASNGFKQFFTPYPNGEDCFAFDTVEEMLVQIRLLLADDAIRLSVAAAGQKHVHHMHTNQRRVDMLIGHVERMGVADGISE